MAKVIAPTVKMKIYQFVQIELAQNTNSDAQLEDASQSPGFVMVLQIVHLETKMKKIVH